MTPWKCAACSSEYTWTDPIEKQGLKLCTMCADDPDRISQAQAAGRISGGWWFAFGILIGMMFAKVLFL